MTKVVLDEDLAINCPGVSNFSSFIQGSYFFSEASSEFSQILVYVDVWFVLVFFRLINIFQFCSGFKNTFPDVPGCNKLKTRQEYSSLTEDAFTNPMQHSISENRKTNRC